MTANRYLVIIVREGVPEVSGFDHHAEVTGFDSLIEAAAFFDRAAEQWSESYLCDVLKGPKV